MGQIPHDTQALFIDAFLQNNRLDHVSQVMGYHPAYLDQFLKASNFILRADGPLSYDFRHYIAIMAAGRHQCRYLISIQKQEFILQGGDHTWLKGLAHIPQKLRDLYDINKILAHRPWLLKKSHIEKLTKGKDSWSLAEVVHAIVILAHFHALCSFVFSCGLNQEVDHQTSQMEQMYHMSNGGVGGGHLVPMMMHNGPNNNHLVGINSAASANSGSSSSGCSSSSGSKSPSEVGGGTSPVGSPPSGSPKVAPIAIPTIIDDARNGSSQLTAPPSPTQGEQEVGITTLVQRMKKLSERTEECTQTELTKRFENVESQSAELGAVGPQPSEISADISQFVDDPTFTYQDFAKRADPTVQTFRVQDYSWDDHGYSLVNRLYNDVGNLLDDKFKTAYNLTYYTMGGRTDVDTSRFRRAIWNYIQCMFGIRHDDYDYGEINQLLERSLKTFVKSACCFPERVTKKDYDRVLREFRHSEKVHVNLMVMEARMQAELLYALRVVMRYMTG